jgi:hypothetical protein
MRDLVAGAVALLLLATAFGLWATLQTHQLRRRRARDSERALGRTIVAELPQGEDLVFFSEDRSRFYYRDERIDKDLIGAVRMLINGAPIAATMSKRAHRDAPMPSAALEERENGVARDRWDVLIDTERGAVLVECGAIRERVSQELARSIYDAVRREVERRNGHAS